MNRQKFRPSSVALGWERVRGTRNVDGAMCDDGARNEDPKMTLKSETAEINTITVELSTIIYFALLASLALRFTSLPPPPLFFAGRLNSLHRTLLLLLLLPLPLLLPLLPLRLALLGVAGAAEVECALVLRTGGLPLGRDLFVPS
jgi:hypothetical protein